MLLLIISLVLAIIGIICFVLWLNNETSNFMDIIGALGAVFAFFGVICSTILGGITLSCYLHESTEKEIFANSYNSLKAESIIAQVSYNSTAANNLNKEIRELNKEIFTYQDKTNDLWVGGLYYDFYNEFKPLPLVMPKNK